MRKVPKYSEIDPELVLESVARQLSVRTRNLVTGERTPVTTLERERLRTWVWIRFFQENNLTTRTIAVSPDDIDENFAVRLRDLTETGFELYRTGYDKWLNALDRRDKNEEKKYLESENVTILRRALEKLVN